uniref:Osteocrin n=1 Tax=Salarias fasciatus TaxID=181472 RepID=A0A672H8G1_SALFA
MLESRALSSVPSLLILLCFQHRDPARQVGVLATRLRRGQVKMGEGLRAKLLRLDELSGVENDVMEPKRKRSFPGNGTPLDRLSVSSMETKQSKAVALPRRRVSPPPIDRIGMSRLPMSRG